ncbi:MAG TPA: Crp/Fnr family transcriptional regulator [Terriglobales bacterium]|nr:Crp/Fnr family transcriptional regulator [Terriglobales bacterium]
MAKKSLRVLSDKVLADGNGNGIASMILLSLPSAERERVLPQLELVRLKLNQVLHEAGEIIKSGYFVNSGVLSVISVQRGGKSVEVGLIGSEGFVGLPLLVGYRTSPTRVVTQGDGTAYRCDATLLKQLLRQCPTLLQELSRFSLRLAMQTSQLAACNRLHDVEERLARWILMTEDRIQSDTLPLTQEFLSHMLGTRRSSVTVAAGALQKAGLLSYTRGNVTILDRKKLENAACDCYGIVKKQLTDWDAEVK